MIVSITKIVLISYSKLIAFFGFNGQIIKELQLTQCKKHKVTGNWNLKVWYTMTLWEKDINDFYRNDTHLEAMKQSKKFSSKIQSHRIQKEELMPCKEAKKLFGSKNNSKLFSAFYKRLFCIFEISNQIKTHYEKSISHSHYNPNIYLLQKIK